MIKLVSMIMVMMMIETVIMMGITIMTRVLNTMMMIRLVRKDDNDDEYNGDYVG